MADRGVITLNAIAFEHITVSTAPIGITVALLAPPDAGSAPTAVRIRVEDQPVRFTIDGTTVSATVGELMVDTDGITIHGQGNLSRLRFSKDGATDAPVSLTLLR